MAYFFHTYFTFIPHAICGNVARVKGGMVVYNICSLSLDAKQLAFSARPGFQKAVASGLTGLTGRWGYFYVAPNRCFWIEDRTRELAWILD